MNPYYGQVSLRAGHRCEYCHAAEVIFNFPFEVEHIIPLARAGADHEANMCLACRSCNLRKSSHIEAFDPANQKTTRLFHPRTGQSQEHFAVNLSNGAIEGLSPIGRATLLRLEMNSETQLSARQQWMRLGIFP